MVEPTKNCVATLPTNAYAYRRRSIVREFALTTSTHGVPGIARSRSKLNGLFWTVSFLAFTGVMIYFVTQSIRNYFQYPTQTSVSIVLDESAAFPAVTICNYSPLRFDLILGPFLDYAQAQNMSNITNTTKFTSAEVDSIVDFLINRLNANLSVRDYSFPLTSMLLKCDYNGIPCNSSDFRSFLSSAYGLCYTFNAKVQGPKASQIRSITSNGGTGKLQLTLYVHSHLYIPCYVQGEFMPTTNTNTATSVFI